MWPTWKKAAAYAALLAVALASIYVVDRKAHRPSLPPPSPLPPPAEAR